MVRAPFSTKRKRVVNFTRLLLIFVTLLSAARRNDPNRGMPKFGPNGKRTESVLEVNRQYRPDL